jgi:hypothetical protein
VGLATYRLCQARRARAIGGPSARPPRGGVALRRTASGGFEEVEP